MRVRAVRVIVMAICEWCGQEMNPPSGCRVETFADFADNIPRRRVPHGSEKEPVMREGQACGDCLAPWGLFHHPGCDLEECPRCGGQALTCGCTEVDEP